MRTEGDINGAGSADGAKGRDPVRSTALNSRVLTIRNRRGLHARASAKFVQTAEAFDAELTVTKDDMSVGGRSIMGLMMLAAGLGSTIAVGAEGPEAAEALDAIAALVDNGFGEEV